MRGLAVSERSVLVKRPAALVVRAVGARRAAQGQIEQLQVRSGTQRVADFPLKLCPAREGSADIALPYDKSVIASRLGMKPESFSRALARLRESGVQTRRNHVSVSDVAVLAEFCEGGSVRGPRGPSGACGPR